MISRILIVEDEDALREALVAHLSGLGYEVEGVLSTEEGLERSVAHPPDLILLDLVTRSLHSLVFLERLREESHPARNAHVIVLTNLEDDTLKQKIAQYSIDAYLIKARVTLEEITAHIKNLS